MNEHAIRQALEHLARGLSDGNLGRIAAGWAMPALMLSDAGATVLGDAGELERVLPRPQSGIDHEASYRRDRRWNTSTCCRRDWRRSMCDGRLTTRLASNGRAGAHTTSCSSARMAMYRYEWP
jgi:hypothetical protein